MHQFVVVRPYAVHIRKRVFRFLEGAGFALAKDGVFARGTDDEAATWCDARFDELSLLLLPFHMQRFEEKIVDGLGVAERLSARFAERHILMPVSSFSFASAFERRYTEARARNPRVVERVIPMPENEIGAEHILKIISQR